MFPVHVLGVEEGMTMHQHHIMSAMKFTGEGPQAISDTGMCHRIVRILCGEEDSAIIRSDMGGQGPFAKKKLSLYVCRKLLGAIRAIPAIRTLRLNQTVQDSSILIIMFKE